MKFNFLKKGLSSGNIEVDAAPLRMFAEGNINVILIHSFAKNFFLYGHRIGCLSFVCPNENIANGILSQLKSSIRRSYSSPPSYGANLIDIILNNEELFCLWQQVIIAKINFLWNFIKEIKLLVDRLTHVRQFLISKLKQGGTHINCDYLQEQKGLFAYMV